MSPAPILSCKVPWEMALVRLSKPCEATWLAVARLLMCKLYTPFTALLEAAAVTILLSLEVAVRAANTLLCDSVLL